MVVKANYDRDENPSVVLDSTSYEIKNGKNLKKGQTSVTISFEGKSVDQPISVQENSVTELKIKTPPTNTEYMEGDNFNKNGMVIEATFKDGTIKEVTDYTIKNGNNLKENQTYVIIQYKEKEVNQPITVKENKLLEIVIDKEPNKTEYVVGQDFDKTGMVIKGEYENGARVEITDYEIINGKKLTIDQKKVTIKYGEKTVDQEITVIDKKIIGITIDKKPTKTQYIQNKEELDLSGGSIKISYNDNSTEVLDMSNELIKVTGFSNDEIGKKTLTVTYLNKTATFEVEVIAEAKPVNSNLDNLSCIVKNLKYYAYTDKNKEEYILVDVSIKGISKQTGNDSYKYYYYISPNKNETNIPEADWIQITGAQEDNNIEFRINTNDIKNYENLIDANEVYIFIKEVVTLKENKSVKISDAILLDADIEPETYLDDKKVTENEQKPQNKDENEKSNNEKDETVMSGKIPQTGIKSIVGIVIIISVLGCIAIIKYKKLNEYVK